VTLRCGERLHKATWMTESKTRHRESTLWQRRYWEHQIRNDLDFERHMDYLYYNPVKHGLVRQVQDWPYSSLHRYLEAGVYDPDWAISSAVDEAGFGE
jgi:putative transposase